MTGLFFNGLGVVYKPESRSLIHGSVIFHRPVVVRHYQMPEHSPPEIAAIAGHFMQHVETLLTKYVSLTRGLTQSAMTKLENVGAGFSGLV